MLRRSAPQANKVLQDSATSVPSCSNPITALKVTEIVNTCVPPSKTLPARCRHYRDPRALWRAALHRFVEADRAPPRTAIRLRRDIRARLADERTGGIDRYYAVHIKVVAASAGIDRANGERPDTSFTFREDPGSGAGYRSPSAEQTAPVAHTHGK